MGLDEPRFSCTQLPLALGASKNVLVLPSNAFPKVLPTLFQLAVVLAEAVPVS